MFHRRLDAPGRSGADRYLISFTAGAVEMYEGEPMGLALQIQLQRNANE